jgi:hypothetical protein
LRSLLARVAGLSDDSVEVRLVGSGLPLDHSSLLHQMLS